MKVRNPCFPQWGFRKGDKPSGCYIHSNTVSTITPLFRSENLSSSKVSDFSNVTVITKQ